MGDVAVEEVVLSDSVSCCNNQLIHLEVKVYSTVRGMLQ